MLFYSIQEIAVKIQTKDFGGVESPFSPHPLLFTSFAQPLLLYVLVLKRSLPDNIKTLLYNNVFATYLRS